MKVIREYDDYNNYLEHQKEKSLDPARIEKWKGKEWEPKVEMFTKIFQRNEEYLTKGGRALGICARTGQEIVALQNLGMDAIGIDIAPHPPLVIQGDAHDLSFEDEEFDFVFSNSFDHSIYPEKFLSEMQRVLKQGGYGLLHVSLSEGVDDYAENIIVDLQPILDLLIYCDICETRIIKRTSYNRELVFKKQ